MEPNGAALQSFSEEWLRTQQVSRVVFNDGTPINLEYDDPNARTLGDGERLAGKGTSSFDRVSRRMIESGGTINAGLYINGEKPKAGTLIGLKRPDGNDMVWRVVEPLPGQVVQSDMCVEKVPGGKVGEGVVEYQGKLAMLPAEVKEGMEVKARRPVLLLSKSDIVTNK